MACPKPHCWKPLLQSKEAPGSLFVQGECNQEVKKSTEKSQNKVIWDASISKFSAAFLASSFELKETAVQTLAAGETGGGSQHPHVFIALFLKPP